MTPARSRTLLTWSAQIIAAIILGMAAITKLASAPDSVALFTVLGAEPWGRFLVGSLELAATLLLLWPRFAVVGAGLGSVLMLGAIGTHLVTLGVAYGGDVSLFAMACTVLSACALTVWLRLRHP